MAACRPSPGEMDELVAFLPRLYAAGFVPIDHWEGGTKDDRGVITVPWPVYNPLVEDFVRQVSAGCWLDYGYSPAEASRLIREEGAVERATLDQVRVMLTWFVRGERFGDGHWAALIESGDVRRLLLRVAALRAGGDRGA